MSECDIENSLQGQVDRSVEGTILAVAAGKAGPYQNLLPCITLRWMFRGVGNLTIERKLSDQRWPVTFKESKNLCVSSLSSQISRHCTKYGTNGINRNFVPLIVVPSSDPPSQQMLVSQDYPLL